MSSLRHLAYRLAGHLPSRVKKQIVLLREDRFLVAVIGVVLDGEGRLMLFRHSYRPFAPWGMPSGLLHEGETFAEAIAREVFEETGLQISVTRPLLIEPGR